MDDDQGNEFDILCYRFMAIAEDVTSWTRSSTSELYSFNVFIIIFSVRALRIIMMGI